MRLAEVLLEPAVVCGNEMVDIADLVLLGVALDRWESFEADTAAGLGLEATHRAPISDDELKRAATDFRYRHGLISAADFIGWLSERRVTVRDLRGVLRRELLRKCLGHEHTVPGDRERTADTLFAEAVCLRVLAGLADAAADRLVALRLIDAAPVGSDEEQLDALLERCARMSASGLAELGIDELRRRLERIGTFELALRGLRTQLDDPDVLRRRIAGHALDWLRVRGDQLSLASESAAREARLVLTVDGAELPELVRRAPCEVTDRSLYVDECDRELAGAVAASAAGEVVGPWSAGASWHLLLVREKTPATVSDAAVHERALEDAMQDALERGAAGRVRRVRAL